MAVGTLALFYPVFLPMSAAVIAYTGHRALYVDWRLLLTQFLTGPGRTSRILLALFLVLNWKSLPLAWTVRNYPLPLSPPLPKTSQLFQPSPRHSP